MSQGISLNNEEIALNSEDIPFNILGLSPLFAKAIAARNPKPNFNIKPIPVDIHTVLFTLTSSFFSFTQEGTKV
jgi:hypothetical protein